MEAYNKLRMNIGFSLVGKRHIVLVSSAIPGEGKSTIAANLAICFARSGKRTLLIDGDMRRGNQTHIFCHETRQEGRHGLSNTIIHECDSQDAILRDVRPNLDLLLVGSLPPNPAELLNSPEMGILLKELEPLYDIILLDMPPINVVSDPLILAKEEIGMLYVVRQNYSDHREIRKALIAAEFSKIDILGFVLYGEKVNGSTYNQSKYYRKYYNNYYSHRSADTASGAPAEEQDKWQLRDKNRIDVQYKHRKNGKRKI